MLKTHEYNSLLKTYKGEELVAVFTEIYSNMVGALKILECLQQFSDIRVLYVSQCLCTECKLFQ